MSAPVLDTSASPSLPTLLESERNLPTITVADLIRDGSITQPGGRPIEAVAITGVSSNSSDHPVFATMLGDVQYSLDQGLTWQNVQPGFPEFQQVADDHALLLGPTDLLRFVPWDDESGTVPNALTFRAWDGRSGTAGQYVDVTGMDGISAEIDTASVTITAVNDAPVLYLGGGLVNSDLAGGEDTARGVVALPDGKILALGTAGDEASPNFGLVRYNADGTLDTGFNGDGIVLTDFFSSYDIANAATMQPDGKILLAGFTIDAGNQRDFALARYNADGTLDTTFGGTGKVVTPVMSSAVEPDEANGLVVQPDGKILVVGSTSSNTTSDFALVRYLDDGTLDATFGGDGKVTTGFAELSQDTAYAVALQSDGKIIVVGDSQEHAPGSPTVVRVVRYLPDGSLDTTFGAGGHVPLPSVVLQVNSGRSVLVQEDGKIILTGRSSGDARFDVMRINSDGTLDGSFGQGGLATIDFSVVPGRPDWHHDGNSLYLQTDGKILVTGISSSLAGDTFYLARFNTDGTPDVTFGGGLGYVATSAQADQCTAYSVTQQADGRILVAGGGPTADPVSDFFVARYNPDGSPDLTFGSTAFTKNGPAVRLDPDAHVRDFEQWGGGNYSGATITLARHGGGSADDHYAAMGNLSASGNDAVLSGVTIAMYTLVAGVLTATFNSNATQDRVNEALSSIGYANVSDEPPSSVQIDWTFSDGNAGVQGTGGALHAVGSTTIEIIAVDDIDVVVSLVGTSVDTPVIA
ncbi:MAG: hypothetical protein ACAH21_05745 [Ramlibacter sp.]|nr:hypothetical protein [Ramlibacter sp.]